MIGDIRHRYPKVTGKGRMLVGLGRFDAVSSVLGLHVKLGGNSRLDMGVDLMTH